MGQWDDKIRQYSQEEGVSEDLVRAIMGQESGGDQSATSSAGAMGLMQLMPETAAEMGVTDPYDPDQNLRGGIRYLRKMLDYTGGDVERALRAYNAGPGAIDESYNYAETNEYVANIMAKYNGGKAILGPTLESVNNTNYYGGINMQEALQDINPYPFGKEGIHADEPFKPKPSNKAKMDGWSTFKDDFLNSWYQNATISFLRSKIAGFVYNPQGYTNELLNNWNTVHGLMQSQTTWGETPAGDTGAPWDYPSIRDVFQQQPMQNMFYDWEEWDSNGDTPFGQATKALGLTEKEWRAKEGTKYETMQWILNNANSPQEALALARMKGEDFKRQERIDQRGSTNIALQYMGAGLGMILDPLNAIPFLGEVGGSAKVAGALASKVGGRFGTKALASFSDSTIGRLAEIGLTNGALNVGDQYVAAKSGWVENDNIQNYAQAFLVGAVTSMGIASIGHALAKKGIISTRYDMLGSETKKVVERMQADNEKALTVLTDTKVKKRDPNETAKIKGEEPQAFINDDLENIIKGSGVKSEGELQDYLKANIKKESLIERAYNGYKAIMPERKEYSIDDFKTDIKEGTLVSDVPRWNLQTNEPKITDEAFSDAFKRSSTDNVQDLMKWAQANQKTKGYYATKKAVEGMLSSKLSKKQFDDIVSHVAEHGDLRGSLIEHMDDSVTLNGKHYEANSPTAQLLTDDNLIEPSMTKPKPIPDKIGDSEVPIDPTPPNGLLKYAPVRKFTSLINNNMVLNRLFGSRYGLLISSKSKTISDWARKVGRDPASRGTSEGIHAVATMKEVLRQRLVPHIEDYKKSFKAYCIENRQLPTATAKDMFNYETTRLFNAMYGENSPDAFKTNSQAVKDAVEAMKRFRDVDLDMQKTYGGIDADFKGSGEFYRRVNQHAVDEMIASLGREGTIQNLKNWFREAVNRKAVLSPSFRNLYIENLNLSPEKAYYLIDEYRKLVGTGLEKDPIPNFTNASDLINYVKTEILSKNDDMYLRTMEDNWVYSVVDGKNSDKVIGGGDRLSFYQQRIPMKTDKQIQLTDGSLFSFDEVLRDNDALRQMEYVANRSTGAVALYHGLGIEDIGTSIREIYGKAKLEVKSLIEKGEMNEKQGKVQLRALMETMHDLTGANIIEGEVRKDNIGSVIQRILLNNSYAQVGADFGFNQLAETVGGIAQVGARALTYYVPALHDFIHNLKYGDMMSAKQLKHFKDQALGASMADYMWFDPRATDTSRYTLNRQGVLMKGLGYIEDATKFSTKVTSMLNQLTTLTNMAVSGIRADVIPDAFKWARGDYDSMWRKNLFSDEKWLEVGVRDTSKIKTALNTYFANLGDDIDALSKRMDLWKKEDPQSYLQFVSFLNNASKRAILQPDIWNTSTAFKGVGGFVQPILWQFKNFSQMALGGHILRILTKPQREDFIQTIATALSGGAIWALRTRVNAEYLYGDDEKGKQAYLEKRLTPEKLLYSGLMRSSTLSGLSFLNDGYEIIANDGTIRTSVDRNGPAEGIMESMLRQAPAIQSLQRSYRGAENVVEATANITSANDTDLSAAQAMLPLERYTPFKLAMAMLADEADSKTKETNRHKRINKYRKDNKLKNGNKHDKQPVQSKDLLDVLTGNN